jgi:catechol 2,3-dioxygenase-like lactoylglutathione lyase family enzyme
MSSLGSPAPRVHHLAISTASFERLRLFYVETLGLPVVAGIPEHTILFLDAGGTLVELIGEAPPDQPLPDGFNRRGWQHLAWEVADVDAVYADLLARGVESYAPPEDFPPEAPTLRIAFLRDPDGNLLELVQPLLTAVAPEEEPAERGAGRAGRHQGDTPVSG